MPTSDQFAIEPLRKACCLAVYAPFGEPSNEERQRQRQRERDRAERHKDREADGKTETFTNTRSLKLTRTQKHTRTHTRSLKPTRTQSPLHIHICRTVHIFADIYICICICMHTYVYIYVYQNNSIYHLDLHAVLRRPMHTCAAFRLNYKRQGRPPLVLREDSDKNGTYFCWAAVKELDLRYHKIWIYSKGNIVLELWQLILFLNSKPAWIGTLPVGSYHTPCFGYPSLWL